VNKDSPVLEKMERPHIMCQMTNWTPTPMLTVKEYCLAIDLDAPDFLGELISRELIPKANDSMKKLTAEDKVQVDAEIFEYQKINYNTFD